MDTTIIPFPLHARLRAANDNGPDGPTGGAVSTRLAGLRTLHLVLGRANGCEIALAA